MRRTPHSIYRALFKAFGPQHWWPAKTPFEVIVGAILTQNTAWTNVEKAILNLRQRGLLSPSSMQGLSASGLSRLIRPAGYFNVKAKRLKSFINFLRQNHSGSLRRLFDQPLLKIRAELLSVHGIGPETADSILLYAAQRPIFVVDAYTRRIFSRIGLIKADSGYEATQKYLMTKLPKQVTLYNEFHALLVELGKRNCFKKRPRCGACAVQKGCRYGRKVFPQN